MEYTVVVDEITEQKIIVAVNEQGHTLFIPFDENNIDYQAYLAWVEENN
jgi:hypothetical protein